MGLNMYSPPAPLGKFVDVFWSQDGYAPESAEERCLPDGSVELVVVLEENLRGMPGALLCGPHSRYFVIDTSVPTTFVGVHFRPGGAFPFLGLPVGELQNQTVDLEDLWGSFAVGLRENLLRAPSVGHRFQVLEEALLGQLRGPLVRHPAVRLALTKFKVPEGRSVGRIATELGVSDRWLCQLFQDEVGLTPKLYCRIKRFQDALSRVNCQVSLDWAALAVECGYYDQAHLIHDFREFCGLTPSAYLALRTEHQNHLRHVA
jgi:AraC-like DNA-binding protein